MAQVSPIQSYFDAIPQMTTDPNIDPSAGLSAIIRPDKTGNFTVEVANGNGKNCTELTKVLEPMLGTVESRTMKQTSDDEQPQGAYIQATV
jgi:hypothetical protein